MDKKGKIHIYCGKGKGKTPAAMGQALKDASGGRSVVVVQFLKGKADEESSFFKRLEPEIKVFRFQKYEESFDQLTKEQQEEETLNMKNALNFAKKVLVTEECDVLVLDEVLGLIPYGILTEEELRLLLSFRGEQVDLILTGVYGAREIWDLADEVIELIPHKTAVDKEIL